jgi:hypothetical protein
VSCSPASVTCCREGSLHTFNFLIALDALLHHARDAQLPLHLALKSQEPGSADQYTRVLVDNGDVSVRSAMARVTQLCELGEGGLAARTQQGQPGGANSVRAS